MLIIGNPETMDIDILESFAECFTRLALARRAATDAKAQTERAVKKLEHLETEYNKSTALRARSFQVAADDTK